MSKPSLLARLRTAIRRRNYSYRTEQAYANWVVRFVKFHDVRHPSRMAEKEVVEYLNYLAGERKVAGSTQNQALCAILFLYEHVLNQPLREMMNFKRAQTPKKLPVVLTSSEVEILLRKMRGTAKLVAQLLYRTGLRISECLRLRVLDLDFSYNQIQVRSGKGKKDRITIMPQTVKEDLKDQVEKVKVLHKKDVAEGYPETHLPKVLSKKYPNAAGELKWQYLFPSPPAGRGSTLRLGASSSHFQFNHPAEPQTGSEKKRNKKTCHLSHVAP